MRRLYWICFFVILLIISCGCLQPANTPVTTTALQTPAVVPLFPTSTTIMQKQLNFTVTSTTTLVNISYNGGPDAADLQSLSIRVYNRGGSYDERTIVNPVTGSTYGFTYRGVSDASRVNIIGTFSNGYQQTVLMYYL